MKTKSAYYFFCAVVLLTFMQACNKQELAPVKKNVGCNCESNVTKGETVTFRNGDKSITVIKSGDNYLMDDIILDMEQINQMLGLTGNTSTGSLTGTGQTATTPWPNGIVYYKFAADVSTTKRNNITKAINLWRSQTRLKFYNVDSSGVSSSNYVLFQNSTDACAATLGMKGGQQLANITDACQWGPIAHEIGHAVGMVHEQQRADRNNEIIVDYSNIQPDKTQNFDIKTGSLSGPLDFNSIMMYESFSTFSIDNTKPAMTRLDGSTWTKQRDSLTTGDIGLVKRLYPALYP